MIEDLAESFRRAGECEVLVEAESRGAPLPRLLACVWPEQLTRFQRLQAAIVVARTQLPRVVAGDIVEALPSVAAEVPDDRHLAVQNSWPRQRRRLGRGAHDLA